MPNISEGTPGSATIEQPPICIQMPGGGAEVVIDGFGPSGKESLDLVAVGHGSAPAARTFVGCGIKRRFVFKDQLDAGHLGQGFAREIILSRSQAAGGNYQPSAAGRDAKRLDVDCEVVGDGRMPTDPNAAASPRRWPRHWLLVSRFWPLVSSEPMETISVCMRVSARRPRGVGLWLPIAGGFPAK